MWEVLFIAIGLVGFGIAAWLDLKTTEFPDWIPYTMIIAVISIKTIFDFQGLFESIVSGIVFLAFGLILYWFKQWGDGDAWLLGAFGFLIPTNMLTMFLVFFLTAFIYLVIYSILIGFKNPSLIPLFIKQLKRKAKGIASIVAIFTITDIVIMIWLAIYMGVAIPLLLPLLLFPLLLATILIFSVYGKLIEENIFRKQIPASKIRPEDVPLEGRWRSLTKEEYEKIRKKDGKIWVKEGVRFSPAFLIAYIICLMF